MAVNEPKKRMRDQHQSSSSPFGYVGLESRGPAKHPLRPGVTPHVAQTTYDTGRPGKHPPSTAAPPVIPAMPPASGSANGSRKCSVGQGQCGAPKDQVPEPGQSAIPVPSSFIAGFNLVRIPKLLAEAHDMHFSRGDHTRWRSVASLLESYGAITGGETREEAVTQQSFINRQGDAIGDISVRRNRGAVGFDLWQNHRENAVDMSAPAESCGPFGRGRGATL
jgi:hypothetical protein